ncbi:MAG TPA: single-stranded-DNA-specific exonuclease RecJ [Terriglobales bacterium]|jgi:single-stranded-DNA-specific exonuclease|nr:single-stranded-DNA-specific exonuclease RecJ [Terriglobales bacterium]
MKWFPKTADAARIEFLTQELKSNANLGLKNPQLASTLARLLVMRGINDIETANRFLTPSLGHLHSPYLMSGMKAAVDRLDAAIERKEGILIYGDYDVDGTTAIVILKTAIELCGSTADFHVPHRIKEGYDLRGDVIERAAAAGIHLIISVDTGIRAFAAAETARNLGVDLIVTDHHLPGQDGMPTALAVLNPNQSGCDYPCKALCGAGVAFKLAQALMERRLTHRDQAPLLKSFMKIAAIATIADAVPLTGENRVFAKLGLEALRSAVNPGLKALLEVAQVSGRPLTSGEVGFRIAPRINAAGRMDVARDVIELFSVKEATRAREIAHKLDQLNADRQAEERQILEAINSRLEQEPALLSSFCLVIDGDGWHRGVIGITATRIVERYCRPTLVISRDGSEAHGSGRSIRAFHLLNALESCAPLFTRFGGHAHAVGFSMPAANLPELCSHLDGYARARLTLADFEPTLDIDAELPFDQIRPELFQALHRLEPFGMGNPEPVFASRDLLLMAPPRVMKEKHVKLRLSSPPAHEELSEAALMTTPRCHPDSAVLPRLHAQSAKSDSRRAVIHNALGWRMAERIQQAELLPGDALDIAFTLDHNDHPEFGGLELSLRDFKRPEKTQSSLTHAASATTEK